MRNALHKMSTQAMNLIPFFSVSFARFLGPFFSDCITTVHTLFLVIDSFVSLMKCKRMPIKSRKTELQTLYDVTSWRLCLTSPHSRSLSDVTTWWIFLSFFLLSFQLQSFHFLHQNSAGSHHINEVCTLVKIYSGV